MNSTTFEESALSEESRDARSARIHGRSGRVVRGIEEYNAGLKDAERLEKYGKMAENAYAFYRGSNHLFWQDFEWDWRMNRFGSYRTRTWLNGDCHAYNFGVYDEHTVGVVYGLNDFDEGIVADYQYDLWRLAVSLVLIARENGDLSAGAQENVLDALASSYLRTLTKFIDNHKAHKTAYTRENTYGRLHKFLKEVEKKQSRVKHLDKWTNEVDGRHQFDLFLDDLQPVSDADRAGILAALPAYVKRIEGDREFGDDFFEVEDIAVRVGAGTGAVGSLRYYVLIRADGDVDSDDVILDVKQQGRPSAYPYATQPQLDEYNKYFPNEGIRHAKCCRALSFHPDDLLGWMKFKPQNKDEEVVFSVRERSPFKKSFRTEELDTKKRFVEMAEQWGRGLATEHARAAEITTYSLAKEVGKLTDGKRKHFIRVVQEVAFGYADQVEEDYEIFLTQLAPAARD